MKDWREDRDTLRELVTTAAKTNGFETPKTMNFCGESFPIADSFFEMCRKELGRIVSTRGADWASTMTGARLSSWPSKIGIHRWPRG